MGGTEPIRFNLRSGQEVAIRPIEPSDEEELRAFVRRLSPESRRFRFFAPIQELSDGFAYRLTHVDAVTRDALVATLPGETAIRAVGRFDRVDDESVEVAFTVEDSMQGQGLATELLWLLAERARDFGYRKLVAVVLPENRKMLSVFHDCGLPCVTRWEEGNVRVELELGEGMVQPRFR
jgi:RimJ/RimL family protein N-acetyltransferase